MSHAGRRELSDRRGVPVGIQVNKPADSPGRVISVRRRDMTGSSGASTAQWSTVRHGLPRLSTDLVSGPAISRRLEGPPRHRVSRLGLSRRDRSRHYLNPRKTPIPHPFGTARLQSVSGPASQSVFGDSGKAGTPHAPSVRTKAAAAGFRCLYPRQLTLRAVREQNAIGLCISISRRCVYTVHAEPRHAQRQEHRL